MALSGKAIYRSVEEDRKFRLAFEQTQHEMFPPLTLEMIFSLYKVERPHYLPVLVFLAKHHKLVGLLLDAIPHIRKLFGEVEVTLEVKTDPEEGFEVLFGIIHTDAKPAASIRLLREFDETWFLGIITETNNLLNFTVDFKANE